uniref:Nuclear respiratory factor 1 NLS/DNA-binding dimerisation domain-containing protein n=1 Tax=Anopheles farauti TaxID=69004 RepID=A0A182QZK7_9DIPT
MPQTLDELEEDGSKNMVSNLPLLFADGYPTSLDKITEAQLEKFIPFMVQCSLGFIHIHSMTEFNKPEWWPSDVEFTKPFKRPKSFTGNWLQKMREIVVVCYSSHRSVYLLRYCTDLASFQPTALRFINNYNSTTSLYERSTNKLLVTFRNENMLYDKEQKINSRKCLLPKQSSSQSCLAAQEEMVISADFDIYLCDNCDAELYSYGAYVEHEKVCQNEQSNAELEETSDDDDVIFCGEVFEEMFPLDSAARAQAEQQKMVSFLSQNFMLRCTKTTEMAINGSHPSMAKSLSNNAEMENGPMENSAGGKHRRFPRRARQVVTLSKCTQIPLASPLGQFMLKSSKLNATPDYVFERYERMERFCLAPPLPPGAGHLLRQMGIHGGGSHEALSAHDRRLPKWLLSKSKSGTGSNGFPLTFKRTADDALEASNHQYKFPRRQFSNRHRMENFMFFNKLLLQRCHPCRVELKRLTSAEVRELSVLPGIERQQREAELAAHLERQRRKELADSAMIIDSINLCSSDDDDDAESDDGEYPQDNMMEDYTESKQQCTSSSHRYDHFPRNNVQTIVQELDDVDSVSSDTNEIANSSFYANSPLSVKSSSTPNSVHSLNPKLARKSFFGNMLSESTYRLNQSHSPLATSPMYLYANCSQTPINVSSSSEVQLANGSRMVAKKTDSLPLKENLVNGFDAAASSASNRDTVGMVAGGQYISSTAQVYQATVQPRTLLLATPITNGHTLIGAIPVPFGSTGTGLHSHASAGSVVQAVTSTTFVNQTVHTRVTMNRTTSGAAVAGTAATNLQ